MKIDLRIIPVVFLCILFMIDLGCIIHEIPPFEAYSGKIPFLVIHAIGGLFAGMAIGLLIKENRENGK